MSNSGLGLGLSLSIALVKMHGQTIEANSEGVAKGSEFIVRLPLATGSQPEVQKFVGALHGKRAKKGVFITTGKFSDAISYQAEDPQSNRVGLNAIFGRAS